MYHAYLIFEKIEFILQILNPERQKTLAEVSDVSLLLRIKDAVTVE